MRHTLLIKEAPPVPPNRQFQAKESDETVEFEYQIHRPEDALAAKVVKAVFDEDVGALTQALTAFTKAGFNPSFIHATGSLNDKYDNAHEPKPRSLLSIVLDAKKPRLSLMQALVTGGCDPFTPVSFVGIAIGAEKGPSSMGRKQWSWFLKNTPIERWLEPTFRPRHRDKTVRDVEPISLVHLAVKHSITVVVDALIHRLGAGILEAQGPALLDWLESWQSEHQADTKTEAQRLTKIMLEKIVLKDVMGAAPTAPVSTRRARL